MKAIAMLQVIYSFFLGLVVTGLVAIGLSTFHPRPAWPEYPGGKIDDPAELARYEAAQAAAQVAQDEWVLTTGIILFGCATVILAVSLWRPAHLAVISNGLLLGGVFTMIYAVGMSLSGAEGHVSRFLVALGALVVTVGAGYLTFVRRTPGEPPRPAADDELADRVGTLERRLAALARALE